MGAVITYLECATCGHPAEEHKLKDEGDLPLVLCDVPCQAPVGPPSIGLVCDCGDYDGMSHPERPSLADAWVYRTEDGGVGVV